MDKAIDQQVRHRAGGRCEYCLMPQAASKLKFPLDHITARQHGGKTHPDNLALCCGRCNCHKGPNIAGIDPHTANMTRLFNPRLDRWTDHFHYQGPNLVGLTDIARATISALNINNPYNIAARQVLITHGEFFA